MLPCLCVSPFYAKKLNLGQSLLLDVVLVIFLYDFLYKHVKYI